jgi:pimeloyl-ACP methyl ester carboxylesterase
MSLEKVRSADGTSIAFDRLGQGQPLVLLAGGMCDRRTFLELADVLAADFEVFNVDRRGRGDSGDSAPYAVEREVEDIAAVIQAAGGKAALFGHSSGAALALEAVAADTDGALGVDRLLLFEPPYQLDPATNRQSVGPSQRYAALVGAGRRGDTVELFMTTVGMPPEAIAGARSQPFWPHWRASPTPWRTTPRSWATGRFRPSGLPLSACRPWCSSAAPARRGRPRPGPLSRRPWRTRS